MHKRSAKRKVEKLETDEACMEYGRTFFGFLLRKLLFFREGGRVPVFSLFMVLWVLPKLFHKFSVLVHIESWYGVKVKVAKMCKIHD